MNPEIIIENIFRYSLSELRSISDELEIRKPEKKTKTELKAEIIKKIKWGKKENKPVAEKTSIDFSEIKRFFYVYQNNTKNEIAKDELEEEIVNQFGEEKAKRIIELTDHLVKSGCHWIEYLIQIRLYLTPPKIGKKKYRIKLTMKQIRVFREKKISKSEKFRRLYDTGLTIKEISKLMESDYSFVYSTISSYKKKNHGNK